MRDILFPEVFLVQLRILFRVPNLFYKAIDTYQVNSIPQINYFLTVKASSSSVNFTFDSQNMEWAFLKIKFWLTARSDILVGTFFLCMNYSIFRKHSSRVLNDILNCNSFQF